MKLKEEIKNLHKQIKKTDNVTEKVTILKKIKTLKEKQCIAKH